MTDVPEIAIAAVNLLPACGDLNAVLLCVVQTIFARLQIPLPPRCNHFEFRRQRLICQLESNLVVAFSGAAMRERRRAFAEREFNFFRHGRSSHESGWLRRQAVEGGWPSARASGSPLDRKRLSAPSLSLRP